MLDVIESNFEEIVLKSELPVLVDFYGVWCPPCRQIAPVLERLATEYAGTCKIVKVNHDENTSLSERYNLTALPTLMFFQNGQVVKTIQGAQPESVLRETIESLRA